MAVETFTMRPIGLRRSNGKNASVTMTGPNRLVPNVAGNMAGLAKSCSVPSVASGNAPGPAPVRGLLAANRPRSAERAERRISRATAFFGTR